MMAAERKLGYEPLPVEEVDNRDLLYSTLFKVNRYADEVRLDIRGDIKDQGKYGTCVAFAIGYAIDKLAYEEMSELFNYIMTKEDDPYPGEEGTRVSDGLKAYKEHGGVSKDLLPYSLYKKPLVFPPISESLKEQAKKYKIVGYAKISDEYELADHLLHGNPAIGGFLVGLTSLFNPEHDEEGNAVLNMPLGTIAGHAMCIIGINFTMRWRYKDGTIRIGFVLVVQSWGLKEDEREFETDDVVMWSETGFGFIPFDYVFGTLEAPDGSRTKYVNELFVPLIDIPFDIVKIDPGNANVTPYIKSGRTFIPLRFIGESLDMEVDYYEHSQGIEIRDGKKRITLNINNREMRVYKVGEPIKTLLLDVHPEVRGDRTFVPIRAIAESFDADVEYFGHEQRIEIRHKDTIIEMWIGRNEARKIVRRR